MADFRPFSTPSPLLVFPSASPTSKLQCMPTKKPPSPIDWTEECHQGMLLDINDAHYHHRSRLTDEQDRNTENFKTKVPREMIMDSTLRRHSTPDFMAFYCYENLSLTSSESPIDIPPAIDPGFKPSKAQSFAVSIPPTSINSTSSSSSNISVVSSSTSSMSYISSISSSENDQPDIPIILKPRLHRTRHISMIYEPKRAGHYDINHTGTSWYSTSTRSMSTTLRENQYQERFAKKKSKFSLLVSKMKRAAERPFKMMDGPGT